MKEKHFPQVLLLGNGLNRAYGGVSWGNLLKNISQRTDIPAEGLQSPMPLQAMLYTNNNIGEAIKGKEDKLYGKIATEEQMNKLKRLLELGFDEILTTNYSYELEMAHQGTAEIKEAELKKLQLHTDAVPRTEPKYLLHTFYQMESTRIWHIHGEAKKPNGIIIDHYLYAALLGRMIDFLKARANYYAHCEKNEIEPEIKSWLDSFILGDVYVLGFSFEFSEFDLWWLLNRKKNENAPHGNVYFFEMEKPGFDEKKELLKLLGVIPVSCGVTKPKEGTDEAYKEFYERAISKIEEMMSKNAPC